MRISITRRTPGAGPSRALIATVATLLGLAAAALTVHAATVDDRVPEASLRLAQGQGQGRGQAQGQGQGQGQGQAQGQGQGQNQGQDQGQQKAKEKQKSGDQDELPAQDRDRDQDRQRDRPDEAQPIYGRELMTEQERREYQVRMRNLETEEERRAYREEHHRQMQSRAAERGMTLPEPASQDAPGDARQKRDSDKGE